MEIRPGPTHVVALAVAVGLLILQPAIAQGQVSRSEQRAVGVKVPRQILARVTGIDSSYNSVTLRDPRGEMTVIEVSPDIVDVTTLQLGDTVNVAYRNALLTRIAKTASNGIRERIETEVVQPSSDGAVNSTRTVEFVATVLKIDRKSRELILRGPTQTQEFDVAPGVSLDTLKVGDSVRAGFISAVAVSLSRVATAPQ